MSKPTMPPWPPTRPGPEPQPQPLWAARPSDAEAKAIRLDCHDHRRRKGVGAAVLALGSTDAIGTPAATTTMTETAPNDEPNEEPTEEPTAAGFTPRKSDLEIGIKILEKECFGYAGCSVTHRIKPKYVGTQELN